MSVNIEDVAKAFIPHYYTQFDGDRASLASLYQDNSMLSFEGEKFQGRVNIMNKLTNLRFTSIKHEPTTVDCQPTPGDGILVFVSGKLVVDGNTAAPLQFSQCFNLMPIPGASGGYYVLNDMFRLNYC